MNDPLATDIRPVSLARGAELAGLTQAELMLLAMNADAVGLAVFPGPAGPLFDPEEMTGLRAILEHEMWDDDAGGDPE